MFCVHCGTPLPEGVAYCFSCGASVKPASPAGGPVPAGSAGFGAPFDNAPPGLPVRYAGFGRRLSAYVLDRFLLGVVVAPLAFLLLVPLAADPAIIWDDADLAPDLFAAFMGAVLTLACFAVITAWLYNALMQSSARQATLGQLALGLRVTDLESRRISFARATGRHFATLLTNLTLGIGYLAMFFSARKQTLHDLMAGTVVVR